MTSSPERTSDPDPAQAPAPTEAGFDGRAVASAAAEAERIIREAGRRARKRNGRPVPAGWKPPSEPQAPWSDVEEATGRLILEAVVEADRLLTRPIPAGAPTRARGRIAVGATWIRNIGAIALLFVAYQLWGTGVQQARVQAKLEASFTAGVSQAAVRRATGAAAVDPAASASSLIEGSVVAQIQIPKLHVDQFVVEGTTRSDLAKGPGHYVGSPLPGFPGNAAVAGHRNTHGAPFDNLDALAPGDEIITTTSAGRFTYVVSQKPFVVPPTDVRVVNDFGDDRLTLTTCTPRFTSRNRLVVVATLRPAAVPPAGAPAAQPAPAQDAAAPATQPRAHPVAKVKAVEDTGWHHKELRGTLPWIGLLIVLAFGHHLVRRRLPALSSVLVLMPVWVWVLFALFEHLDKLLPANV